VTAVAGTGVPGRAGGGGLSSRAELAAPSGIAVDSAGDVAVADSGNCRVELIAGHTGRHFGIAMKARDMYTVAGSGCGRDRSRTASSSMEDPTGVAFDATGDLYIADASANRILELPARSSQSLGLSVRDGQLTTVAGTGRAGSSTDGRLARSSPLDEPEGIAVDSAGDLYIADMGACRVDEVPARSQTRASASLATGHLYAVAGTGVCGFSGDGGSALNAELWAPSAVTVDAEGDLLIADEGNSAVREVPVASGTFYGVAIAAGDIGTVAGQGIYTSYLNDGLPASGLVADVNYPSGIAVDGAGNLFIADSYDRSIREVPAHDGVLFGRTVKADDMYTLAGILAVGGVAAGDATHWILTRVTYPEGVAVARDGSLYFSDQGANTVRRISAS
jgi:sugar lactone lactonase YvrE